MVRKFITYSGEVLEETDWKLRRNDNCFYCNQSLIMEGDNMCPDSQDYNHDWITLVNPSEYRR